ncbi:hypothetical protein [Phenylobacterium sp.]|jgi:hypothetical protein|nr:hypothetical protein [Phenylobacterium sp.]
MGNSPKSPPPKNGVIFRRYRKVRGGRVLDAHDYGYEAWPIPLRK